jgi:1,4-dihydroxy-2-naphthoate octaprenyltransferase
MIKLPKKNTLVVYMGLKKAKTYQKLLITVAIISFFTIITIANNSILWITCLPIILLIRHLFFVNNNKELEKFDSQLKIIALSCFASCLSLLIFSMLI